MKTTGKISLALAVLFLYSIFATAAFALSDDKVLSGNIKEADGTTGQNTNTGSGVKTGHIQDGAITTRKIADGAVTGNKVADGSVSAGKIADGAVTDAKIAGPISASKISSVGLNADTVDGKHAADLAPAVHTHSQSQVTGLEAALAGKADVTHNHDALYQQKYGKVAVVAQTGGDYTNPLTAMNDLATWCGTPSATNPCLLKLMPGIYDIGSNTVQMQPFVDIEGSGENVTKVKGNSGALLSGANNASLRFLTVESENGGLYSAAIMNNMASPVIMHVTAIANNGTQSGITNLSSSATLINVTVIGSTWGIYNAASSTTMINVTATAGWVAVEEYVSSSKIYNLTATGSVALKVFGHIPYGETKPVIYNSQLTGSDLVIENRGSTTVTIHGSILKGVAFNYDDLESIIKIGVSQWDGQIAAPGMVGIKCFQVYNSNFDNVLCR